MLDRWSANSGFTLCTCTAVFLDNRVKMGHVYSVSETICHSIIMELYDNFWNWNPFHINVADCPRILHCVMRIVCTAPQKWNLCRCSDLIPDVLKVTLMRLYLPSSRNCLLISAQEMQNVCRIWWAKIWTIFAASHYHFLLVTGCKYCFVFLTGLWFLPKPAFGLNTNDDEYNLSKVIFRFPFIFSK